MSTHFSWDMSVTMCCQILLPAWPPQGREPASRGRGDLAYVGWEAITHSPGLRAAAAEAEAEPDWLPSCLLILLCKSLSDLSSHRQIDTTLVTSMSI